MKRVRIKMTITAPPGGSVERLLDCIRDYGYTVTASSAPTFSGVVHAEVLAPYGETVRKIGIRVSRTQRW